MIKKKLIGIMKKYSNKRVKTKKHRKGSACHCKCRLIVAKHFARDHCGTDSNCKEMTYRRSRMLSVLTVQNSTPKTYSANLMTK